MGDFAAHPATTGFHLRIGQVDAIAWIGHLIAFPGGLLDWESHLIQPCFSTHATGSTRERATYSAWVVDPTSLWSVMDTGKRRFICSGERKYFSSASLIKISDNVHTAAGLGNAKILAVKHLPFDMIPQSLQRIEDRRKRPAAVMVKQAGNIFKQQIARLPGFSQSGKFKE